LEQQFVLMVIPKLSKLFLLLYDHMLLWFLLVHLIIRDWWFFGDIFFFNLYPLFLLRLLYMFMLGLMRNLPMISSVRSDFSWDIFILLFFISVVIFFIWVIGTKESIASKSRKSLNDFLFLVGFCYFVEKQPF